MGDIISFGDKHKRLLKIAEGWFRKKAGASDDTVHADLSVCGNPTFSRIYGLINITADSIKEKYQARVVKSFGSLLLWILYKDTAYRDIVLWMVYQLLKKAEILMKEIEPYLKQPDEWYVNAWHESKKHTSELRKKGDVSAVRKADDESIFTPAEQVEKLNKLR